MLRQLERPNHPDLIVGTETLDDAGVFRLNSETAPSDQVYNHGYAVLQLGDPATATATYYEVPGDGSSAQSTEVWHENLCRAEPPALA